MTSIGAIFTSTYHTKQLNPWPNLSTNHVVNHSQLSACQGGMEPVEKHLNARGRPTSLRNKPQQKQTGNFQPQCLAEQLVNVYSHCLMVKVCFAVLCMEASFSQIQSHSQCNDTRAKTNILNESEQLTFTTNEYSNILSVFSFKLLA